MSLKDLRSEFDAMKAEFQGKLRVAFQEECAGLFAKYPELETFAWTQYTPYFNDGDPCVFEVNTFTVDINGEDRYNATKSGIAIDAQTSENFPFTVPPPDWWIAAEKEAIALLESVPADVMEIAFGDHVEVTAHRDGTFTTEDYEHD